MAKGKSAFEPLLEAIEERIEDAAHSHFPPDDVRGEIMFSDCVRLIKTLREAAPHIESHCPSIVMDQLVLFLKGEEAGEPDTEEDDG